MNKIEWLIATQKENEINGVIYYSLDELKNDYEIKEVCKNGWILYYCDDGEPFIDTWLKFAVLTFYMSETNGTNIQVTPVFYGEGPTGALKECRHTYWGDNGYLFYPNADLIIAALTELKKYYTMD